MNHPPSVPQLVYPSNGLSDLGTTIEFKWNKSLDPDGNNVTYDLYVCEDNSFPLECIYSENIASLNRSDLLSNTGIGLFFIGVVFAGGLGNKRQVIKLILLICIVAISSLSCGGGSSDPPPSSDEVTQIVSGLKPGTTYYWKVVATDENDSEVHSETRSFTTS